MQDAGYDVRDYRKVAPRYGTNEDLEELFRQAHARGMHILLDLVPGHTSEQHEWFRESPTAHPQCIQRPLRLDGQRFQQARRVQLDLRHDRPQWLCADELFPEKCSPR